MISIKEVKFSVGGQQPIPIAILCSPAEEEFYFNAGEFHFCLSIVRTQTVAVPDSLPGLKNLYQFLGTFHLPLKAVLGSVMANIPLRWGLTGTIPKDEVQAMQMRCNIGDVIAKVAASELQDKGVLSKCHVNVVQLASKLEFGDYASELKWLVSDKDRMEYISKLIDAISKTGNTLVLVDRLEAGHAIVDNLCLHPSQFVSGSTAKKKRQDSYSMVKHADNEIIVATYGVAAVGLNIPRIFNLVLIEPGKSFVRTIQSIGRGLRRAKDKDFVQIWDLAGTNKYSARHVRERLTYYTEAEYPFERMKITDWEDGFK